MGGGTFLQLATKASLTSPRLMDLWLENAIELGSFVAAKDVPALSRMPVRTAVRH